MRVDEFVRSQVRAICHPEWYLLAGLGFIALGIWFLLEMRSPTYPDPQLATHNLQPATVPTSANWPMFRGNRALTANVQGTLPTRLRLVWRFETGDAIPGSASIQDGVVYFGSTDGNVYALSLDEGERLWSYDTGDSVEGTPCVLEGAVYIGSSSGFLYVLDATSGNLIWQYEADAEILGSVNWFREGDALRILVGSYDNRLYCLDAVSGDPVWSYEAGNYINGAAAVAGNLAIFGSCAAFLRFISLADGQESHAVETNAYIAGSPAVMDSHVYLGNYDGQFLCVDLHTGDIVWEYLESKTPIFASPAVSERYVVFGSRD